MFSPGSCPITTSAAGVVPPRLVADSVAARKSDRKSTRLNSSHGYISYAVFCLKKKTNTHAPPRLVESGGVEVQADPASFGAWRRVRLAILLVTTHRPLPSCDAARGVRYLGAGT